jgi:pimeloyl-ACP methyl ester carboxylesterase
MKADQWWESGYVEALSVEFEVLAVDRLGHGRSDKPHDIAPYEESLIMEDLLAILDTAGIERTLVWGFSMGAATAAQLAIRRPERVAALVCGGGGPFPPEPGREERLIEVSEAVATMPGFTDVMRSFGVDDERVVEIAARNDLAALSASMHASASWSPSAAEIRCPMLWYVGSEDLGGFLPADLELAERHGFETFEIQGASHATSFTESAVPLQRVLPFLRRHTALVGPTSRSNMRS